MTTYKEPNWDLIENDVTTRLHYLKAIWRHTERDHPETIQVFARDLIHPALIHIALFVDCVEIGEET